MVEPMNAAERDSLLALCKERLGRDWKHKLHMAWMNGNYPYEVREHSGRLQTLRNSPEFAPGVFAMFATERAARKKRSK